MTDILVHELAVRANELFNRLRTVLAAIPAPDLLARAAYEPGPLPRMVFTGQFSGGKSMLIKALTDGRADVVIDARPATDTVTDYSWDGAVLLTDTPGVQSGSREHDDLAERALTGAEFVVFVVSVDLFDEAASRHLRRVVNELDKGLQTLVVITKCGTMSTPHSVRVDAVRQALQRPDLTLPVIETDAEFYLRSLAGDSRADQLRAASNIDALRVRINALSRERGYLAGLATPFQQIKALSIEAESLVVADPTEAAALALLARQRRALSDRRIRIDSLIRSLSTEFKRECKSAGEGYLLQCDRAAANPAGSSAAEAEAAKATELLRARLRALSGNYGLEIERILDAQLNDLASEVAEIDGSPRALALRDSELTLSPTSIGSFDPLRAAAVQAQQAGRLQWISQMAPWLRKFNQQWGTGETLTDASGSFGHKLVLRVGHTFGMKFKPWEAVRYADVVGKVGTYSEKAIPYLYAVATGVQAWQDDLRAAQEERADQARRKQLVMDVLAVADQTTQQAADDLRGYLDPSFVDAYEDIDKMVNDICTEAQSRTAAGDELRAIRDSAGLQLALIV